MGARKESKVIEHMLELFFQVCLIFLDKALEYKFSVDDWL